MGNWHLMLHYTNVATAQERTRDELLGLMTCSTVSTATFPAMLAQELFIKKRESSCFTKQWLLFKRSSFGVSAKLHGWVCFMSLLRLCQGITDLYTQHILVEPVWLRRWFCCSLMKANENYNTLAQGALSSLSNQRESLSLSIPLPHTHTHTSIKGIKQEGRDCLFITSYRTEPLFVNLCWCIS